MRIAMPLIIAATGLCLFATGSALAEEPAGGSPPQSATYAPEDPATADHPRDEVVCKEIKQLGSRIQSHKVCMTRADWASEERRAQETTDQMQRSSAPQKN